MKIAAALQHWGFLRWGAILLPLGGLGCAMHPGLLQAQLQTKALECDALLSQSEARRTLHVIQARLQSQGMRLLVQSCPRIHLSSGRQQQVVAVQLWVTDSEVASRFVRGPLADGEAVDMGLGKADEPVLQEDVSPDVEYNRMWLRDSMRAQGWQQVAQRWWAFTPAWR